MVAISSEIMEIPPAYLRDVFSYDDGVLYWRKRPLDHFSSERGCKVFNVRFSGNRADRLNKYTGYHNVRMTYEGKTKMIYAHRIIWAMIIDKWPDNQIHHIDGDRSNNRIDNLMDTTQSVNMRNRKANVGNPTGVCGVSFLGGSARRPYRSQIVDDDGKEIQAAFETLNEATAWRKQKETEISGYNLTNS
ncbi:MAG: HNH endonuclease signature motif containing protein [Parvibaculales bacterium]